MNDISLAQLSYLKSCRTHKRLVQLCRLGLLLLFVGLWELSAGIGWIDSFIFSSPSKIMQCFFTMTVHNNLFFHIGITLFETIVSFILVMFFSLFITIMLWYSKKLSETLDPYLVILNSLPKSALAPLLIVWLGANYKTIILTGMSVAIFGTILNLSASFSEVDSEKVKLIQTLGGSRTHALTKVILPSNVPNIISLMKINIGLCLVGVIIGEFIASKCGLGYLIIYGSQVFKLDWVIMSIIILCIIATGLYFLINWMEKIYFKRVG